MLLLDDEDEEEESPIPNRHGQDSRHNNSKFKMEMEDNKTTIEEENTKYSSYDATINKLKH